MCHLGHIHSTITKKSCQHINVSFLKLFYFFK
nr:MAG TPA: hypothetical protein [Caudoviricetes sp.]